jgi:hypothetical protein
MDRTFKQLTDFLVNMGIEKVPHTGKSYLAHLIGVYKLMEAQDCNEELCQAGMFHSIYGTQQFQGFKLELDRRPELQKMIGDRAEKLGYLNCAMDRASFDQALDQPGPSYRFKDRITGEEVTLDRQDFDDLCRIHLYDWLEQVPRSRFGWGFRRQAYRRMAERLGGNALTTYDRVFAQETVAAQG